MQLAPIPADEVDRIADLHALNLLDTPREPRFDRITDLAADVFEVPMVFVTLVDSDRQWFKSACGLSIVCHPGGPLTAGQFTVVATPDGSGIAMPDDASRSA